MFLETHMHEDRGSGDKAPVKEQQRLGLVVLTIELEQRLAQMPFMIPSPHIMTSPYRRPLTRYLNK